MTRKKLGFMNINEDADTLNRNEMRNILAGSGGGGCGPSCSGCNRNDSSHGPCVKWVCESDEYGGWCVPKSSDCCLA